MSLPLFLFKFLSFTYFFIFIVIQLQLSAFSPHPSTPPQPNPPPSPTSTLPLDFVHVSFIVVPVIPSPHYPLPTPLWVLLDCYSEVTLYIWKISPWKCYIFSTFYLVYGAFCDAEVFAFS